jgi:predicted nucleic acid-binding protein
MEILKINTSNLLNQMVGDWQIKEIQEKSVAYILFLQKESAAKMFIINRPVIKTESINQNEDSYEIWYNDYKDSKLLTLTEISDVNILISAIESLINKYSKYDN